MNTLGYTIEANPMTFAKGAVEIHRLSKLDTDAGDVLLLDLLLVTPQIETAWKSRTEVEWENIGLQIVSPEGLIALKSLRRNAQDVEDIRRLEESYES